MKPQPTKQDERKLIEQIRNKRVQGAPCHPDRAWVAAFWKRLMS